MYQSTSPEDGDQANSLLSSAAGLIVTSGLKGLTLRSVAQNSGVSPSLPSYRYGSREKLLVEIFRHARAQEEAAWARRTGQLGQLASQPGQLASLALAIAAEVISRAPDTAMLGWIGSTAAERHPALRPVMADWPVLASAFWAAQFENMGMDPELAPAFAAGLGGAIRIGLLSGADARLTVWMNDVVRRLCERITGAPASAPGDSPARMSLERLRTGRPETPPDSRTDTPQRILDAASALILSHGPEALTHRLIARESGIALSSMTHHFRSIDEIMFSAFDRIYDRASRESRAGLPQSNTIDSLSTEILPALFERSRQRGAESIAMDEIILVSSRSSGTLPIAGALLAMTGRTSTVLLQSVDVATKRADRLDGQIFRFVLTGLSDQAAILPEADRPAWITGHSRRFLHACWTSDDETNS